MPAPKPQAQPIRTGGTQQRPAPIVVRRALRPVAPTPSLPPTPTPPAAPPPAPLYADRFARAEAYRVRQAARLVAQLQPLEAEIVTRLVAAGAGGGAPWTTAIVATVARQLGVTSRRLHIYLMAVRRTLGRSVPRRSEVTGPMVRDQAWIDAAMQTREWGPFQPLLDPNWPGYWEPEPTMATDQPLTPRYPTRRPPRSSP